MEETDDKEEKMLVRQLERHKNNKIKLDKSFEYNTDVTKMNKFNRDFSEKWTKYKRELKEQEEKDGLKMIKDELKNIDQHIKDLESQIKNPELNKPETYHG